MSVYEAIRKITQKFEEDTGHIALVRYSDIDFELSFNLEDEIIFMLVGMGIEHNVELVEAYNDYCRTYYELCVSYIENGTLRTYNVPVYA